MFLVNSFRFGLPAPDLGLPLIEYLLNNSLSNTGTGGTLFTGSPTYSVSSPKEGSHSLSAGSLSWSGSTFLSPASFIYEFWIKVNTYPGPGAYHGIFGRRNGYSDQVCSAVFNGDDNNFYCDWRTTGTGPPTNSISFSRSLFPLGVWTHFRFSRSGGVFRVFIDGVQQGSSITSDPISTATSGTPTISGSSGLARLDANYDLIRYYDTVGSADSFTPPTVSALSYRYYRIYVTALPAGNDGYVSMGQVELRATVGGADITSSGMTTYYSSRFNPATSSEHAFDEDTGTYWASDGGALPQWISVDLGSPATIPAEVAIWNQTLFPHRAPFDFKLQGSTDNSTWNDIGSWTSVAAGTPALVTV
jgi:Concanavalin A-like lectin/glucanases superfamily/F5/8 type C domain